MNIPEEIKIGPHVYRVILEDDFIMNHGAFAQTRHIKNSIILDPSQNDSQLADSLLHEILHCINHQVEFAPKDRETEESAVARLAPMLLQVIRDNPEVFKGGVTDGFKK